MLVAITKEAIEESRTADQLLEWVRGVHEKFGASEEGRSASRRREGDFLKEFYEEVWPLASYAHLFYSGRVDVFFQPVVGNQPYDALMLDAKSHQTLHHVEITAALDGDAGYQERLRTLHLEEYGHAPLTGAALSRSRATGGILESEPEAVEHGEARDAELRQVRQAVERKAGRTYRSGTILVVEFRSLHFTKPRDRQMLNAYGAGLFESVGAGFVELAIVDVSAKLGFRYPPDTGSL